MFDIAGPAYCGPAAVEPHVPITRNNRRSVGGIDAILCQRTVSDYGRGRAALFNVVDIHWRESKLCRKLRTGHGRNVRTLREAPTVRAVVAPNAPLRHRKH